MEVTKINEEMSYLFNVISGGILKQYPFSRVPLKYGENVIVDFANSNASRGVDVVKTSTDNYLMVLSPSFAKKIVENRYTSFGYRRAIGMAYGELIYTRDLYPVFKGCTRAKLPYKVIEKEDFVCMMGNFFETAISSIDGKTHVCGETMLIFIHNVNVHRNYVLKGDSIYTADKYLFKYMG